jgi:hypothetical protein
MLILALLAGLDWHKRHPLEEPEAPRASPPAEAGATTGQEAAPAENTNATPAPVPDPVSALEAAPATRLPDPQPVMEAAPVAESRERLSRPEPAIPIPDRARERVSEEFRSADRNGDRYLSLAEVESRFPGVAREFSAIDRDGDQSLSLDEFITFRRLQFERRAQPAPKP